MIFSFSMVLGVGPQASLCAIQMFYHWTAIPGHVFVCLSVSCMSNYLSIFEAGSYYVALASLELTM